MSVASENPSGARDGQPVDMSKTSVSSIPENRRQQQVQGVDRRRKPAPCPLASPGCKQAEVALRVASKPAWSPMSRPVFPRVNSATSGFFFWGMIELSRSSRHRPA